MSQAMDRLIDLIEEKIDQRVSRSFNDWHLLRPDQQRARWRQLAFDIVWEIADTEVFSPPLQVLYANPEDGDRG